MTSEDRRLFNYIISIMRPDEGDFIRMVMKRKEKEIERYKEEIRLLKNQLSKPNVSRK